MKFSVTVAATLEFIFSISEAPIQRPTLPTPHAYKSTKAGPIDLKLKL